MGRPTTASPPAAPCPAATPATSWRTRPCGRSSTSREPATTCCFTRSCMPRSRSPSRPARARSCRPGAGWWRAMSTSPGGRRRYRTWTTPLGFNDPTHLPVYLTNNVMLFIGTDPTNCCVIGFHGASEVVGQGTGSGHGNGNQPVQTFAWASYVTPGFFNPVTAWALQDIHPLSHEIAEWGDDPFVNNTVEPWLTPTAPQYGCTDVLETGVPVVGIGFAKGTNTFEQ